MKSEQKNKIYSFLLTTYNKLEMLDLVMKKYIKSKKENWEIIVSDGFSNDGTVEYLIGLYNTGHIDYLILSEKKDSGEWDGYKKCLDKANGEYLKFLTDDDFFDYEAIEKCFDFLEENDDVEWLNSQGFDNNMSMYHHNHHNDPYGSRDCGLPGLGFFIKKTVSRKIDLFSNKYGARTDKFFTTQLLNSELRGSTTNLCTWVRILNDKSNTVLYNNDLEKTEIRQVDKSFKINIDDFSKRFNQCEDYVKNINNNTKIEFTKLWKQ